MTCPKLLLALMAAAVQTAPQISQRGPFRTSNNFGQTSSSFSAPSTIRGSTFSTPSSFGNSFSAPSSSFGNSFSAPSSSFGNSFSAPSSFGNSFSAPALSPPRLPSPPVSSQIFSTASREPFRVQENYGPASYNFNYKVADDVEQTYIAQSETRDGSAVTGNYNYVDPTGSLVTVNYRADDGGFRQERTVQEGAVNIRNTPGALSQNFVSGPTNIFGSRPSTTNFISRPSTTNFVSRPSNNFISRPLTTNFGARPTNNFGTSGKGRLFNSRPASGFSTTRGSSFPTIRG